MVFFFFYQNTLPFVFGLKEKKERNRIGERKKQRREEERKKKRREEERTENRERERGRGEKEEERRGIKRNKDVGLNEREKLEVRHRMGYWGKKLKKKNKILKGCSFGRERERGR